MTHQYSFSPRPLGLFSVTDLMDSSENFRLVRTRDFSLLPLANGFARSERVMFFDINTIVGVSMRLKRKLPGSTSTIAFQNTMQVFVL